MNTAFHRVTLLLCCLVAAPAIAKPIDAAESQLSAVVRQLGVSVEGDFRRFDGEVNFDPAAPEAATARLVIDTGSFDLGMRDFNAEVAKPEWLDVAGHPEAVFTATGLTRVGEGDYRLTGQLALKGREAPVDSTVTVTQADGYRYFEGEWSLSRATFGIGGSSWDGVVDDAVRVRFRIAQPLGSE
jgi:polyisoprenoid-binding protein YceI